MVEVSHIYEYNVEEDIRSLVNILGFDKSMVIPLKIIKDPKKFFNFILPKDKPFALIVPTNYEIVKIVNEIRFNLTKYILISENLKDIAILLIKNSK
ncbi:DUF4898 domain-containing protein [Sulfurisphaera javensis]|uniref:DUF4898 domain-containing protein n=1 Tax=Sulfurisphaera javensis TaxID=2049879 RepID=A0AAT9GV00_9CREN